MNTITIDIGQDFSDVPSGRFPEDGEFNGQKFRQEILVPALRHNEHVSVDIDHTEGYGSSFLEEAFGGLIRCEGFSKEDLDARLTIVSNQPRTARYKRKIEQYLVKAGIALGAG
jgi:hypothetical protein